MSSSISCPGCQHPVSWPDNYTGQRLQCALCRTEFALQVTPTATKESEPAALDTAYATEGSATSRFGAIYCIRCGTKYARTDDACPNCGQPIQEPVDARSPDDLRLFRPRLQPINGWLLTVGATFVLMGVLCFILTPVFSEGIIRGPRHIRTFINMVGFGMSMAFALAAFSCFMRWLHQAWGLILRGDEDYSPSVLIGLMFVPFFNFYWIFRVIPGLSLAVNQQLHAIAPTRDHANGWGAGVAACVLALFPPLWPIAICMFLAWVFLTNHAINRLMRYHEQRRIE